MKAYFINPFIDAAMHLFKDYMGLSIDPGKPFLLSDPQDLKGVSAVIGLGGDTTGAVVLTLRDETAVGMVSLLEGNKYTDMGDEILDGVGEIINIIAGNAKKDLLDHQIVISLPGIITGSDYRINWPQGVPVISIPFESDLGPFAINVSIKEG